MNSLMAPRITGWPSIRVDDEVVLNNDATQEATPLFPDEAAVSSDSIAASVRAEIWFGDASDNEANNWSEVNFSFPRLLFSLCDLRLGSGAGASEELLPPSSLWEEFLRACSNASASCIFLCMSRFLNLCIWSICTNTSSLSLQNAVLTSESAYWAIVFYTLWWRLDSCSSSLIFWRYLLSPKSFTTRHKIQVAEDLPLRISYFKRIWACFSVWSIFILNADASSSTVRMCVINASRALSKSSNKNACQPDKTKKCKLTKSTSSNSEVWECFDSKSWWRSFCIYSGCKQTVSLLFKNWEAFIIEDEPGFCR